jgi:quercetin dioxygenase-like cupin family protein
VIIFATAAVVVAATAGAVTAQAPKPSAPADASHPAGSPHHVTIAAADIKWGPAPPSLPPGAQMAVLSGDPSKAESFVIRAKFPDGYRVQPHFHPTDENIVVLSGSFSVGMGDTFNESGMTSMAPGAYALMPKTLHHYAMAKGETIIQLHGMGPFQVTYVNPSDDPRTKK